MIKLHILNTSGSLDALNSVIKKEFDKSIKEIQAKIPVDKVDVVVYDDPEHIIPEIGIGGFTPTNHRVMVPIDPKKENIKSRVKYELKKFLAHELYHCLRKYSYSSENHTLLGSLINEGLADHFDLELNGGKPHPWDRALSEKELKRLIKLAKKEYLNKKYDHEKWFFGSNDIPRWAGYSIGFYIVEQFFAKNPDKKPSSVYKQSVKEFLV